MLLKRFLHAGSSSYLLEALIIVASSMLETSTLGYVGVGMNPPIIADMVCSSLSCCKGLIRPQYYQWYCSSQKAELGELMAAECSSQLAWRGVKKIQHGPHVDRLWASE